MNAAIWILQVFLLASAITSSTPAVTPQNAFNTPIPILLYHSVTEETGGDPLKITPARFEQQMRHLRERGYHPLFFTDLPDGSGNNALPSKPVIITLDDGYEDNYTKAFPILKRTGMKATVFAITGNVGRPNYLTWRQLRIMEASGAVDTESHTVTHPDLTKIGTKEKAGELVKSRDTILRRLGHPSIAFAYPYGKYDQATVEAVRSAGYLYAVTGENGYAEIGRGRLTLPRNVITGDMTLEQFHALLP